MSSCFDNMPFMSESSSRYWLYTRSALLPENQLCWKAAADHFSLRSACSSAMTRDPTTSLTGMRPVFLGSRKNKNFRTAVYT